MKDDRGGPQFTRFFKPILKVLKQNGGSGTVSEVIDQVIEMLHISDAEQEATLKSGQSRIRNQVQWARLYLVYSDLIDASRRGVWSLTEKGVTTKPDDLDDREVLQKGRRKYLEDKSRKQTKESFIDKSDETEVEMADYKTELLDLIKNLPPEGFERLCQRLLRESGFKQVIVTGRTGDGGIDGIGTLQVNPFVSFNVLFQCKRYQGSVTPSQIRDFRGAMMGRADKGIIITTGTFTVDAKKEALRDGVPNIELVDGEILIQMFEQLELGLLPRKTYGIDHKFFEEFRR